MFSRNLLILVLVWGSSVPVKVIANKIYNSDAIADYVPPIESTNDENNTRDFMSFASQAKKSDGDHTEGLIKKAQKTIELPETDAIDEVTLRSTPNPRCGAAKLWNRNYKFDKKNLKYSIFNYSPDMSPCQTRNILRKAFRIWEEVTDLTFQEAVYDEPDIKIRFQYGNHSNHALEESFDGVGGELAHAFPPNRGSLQGELHFDEAEFWTLKKKRIVETYSGNSFGKPCVFPFLYKSRYHYLCTPNEDNLQWCSTTSNYDKDKQWGFCPQPELFTFYGNSKGRPCKFPFKYNKVRYDSCTNVSGPSDKVDGYFWCATTSNFNRDRMWGYCPTEVKRVPFWKRQDLLYTAVHEIGHVLGFSHSKSEDSIMYGTVDPDHRRISKLSNEDIKEVQKRYGKRKRDLPQLVEEKCGGQIDTATISTTTTTTTARPTTTKNPTKKRKSLCKIGAFDASVMLQLSTFFFKGSLVWEAPKFRTPEFPTHNQVRGKKIEEKFVGGPRRVDAGFMRIHDKSILLFRGKKYWQYTTDAKYINFNVNWTLNDISKPVMQLGLTGKSTIKAIVPVDQEQVLIFYKDYYISYNPMTLKQDDEKFPIPEEISAPDAAVGVNIYANSRIIHFFKKNNAYRVKIEKKKKGKVTLRVKKTMRTRKYLRC